MATWNYSITSLIILTVIGILLIKKGMVTKIRKSMDICMPLSIYIYLYISNGCHKHKTRLFKWIELSVAVKRIYVDKKQMWYISV